MKKNLNRASSSISLFGLIATMTFVTRPAVAFEPAPQSIPEQEISAQVQKQPDVSREKQYQLGAGIGYMAFDFKEKLETPHKSIETGALPFVLLSGEYKLGVLPDSPSIFAEVQYASGELQYDGSYQNQVGDYRGEATSKTPSNMSDFHVAYVHRFSSNNSGNNLDGYIGFGQHRWFRGTEQKAGHYDVHYKWSYLPIGLRYALLEDSSWEIQSKLEIRLTFDGMAKAMTSQTDPKSSDMNLPLGSGSGFRAELPITRKLNETWKIRLSPFYEQINLGRGKFTQAVYDGQPVEEGDQVYGAREPASRTQVYGSHLGITASF